MKAAGKLEGSRSMLPPTFEPIMGTRLFRPICFIPRATMALSLVVLLSTNEQVHAQAGASKVVSAGATIVQALKVSRVQDLNFGLIVSDTIGGLVVIGPDGSRSSTGPVLLVQSQTGTAFQPAQFVVTGAAGFLYTISLPTVGQSISSSGTTSPTMSVDTFVSDPIGTATLISGVSTFKVGATLHVQAGKVAGAYSGSFSITVAYQ
jgi:hypothetical protein